MEVADREYLDPTQAVPKVPIKTYMWEDVRRSKIKGGYPWTHLNKTPFHEEAHPEHYTMEEFRRTRSSSALTRPDRIEIQELANGSASDKGSTEPIITEAVTPEVESKPIASLLEVGSVESLDNISQYLDKEEEVPEEKVEVTEPSTSKQEEGLKPSTLDRTERSKSEEPKRKRKLSMESSYSRISRLSLSKLALMKKLKNAKDKIKLPKLSFRKKHKSEEAIPASPPKKKESIADKVIAKTERKRSDTKDQKPLYIHIPLKPPPGETDEFSYLEFAEKAPPTPVIVPTIPPEQPTDSLPSSPEPTQDGVVQFILLTPPSDDEILDTPVPETPSESGSVFFDNNRIDELKTLAKNVVDDLAAKKKLATVAEDVKESNGNGEDEPKADEKLPEEKMVIDEEDGLQQTETLKAEASPKIKKKVSFKRKSKEEPKEGIYEDVQAPKTEDVVVKSKEPKQQPGSSQEKEIVADVAENSGKTKVEAEKSLDAKSKIQILGNSQSMSVDEEKTYLDEKIVKTTSLEEDYNKWSKINDHEYEPVNPPPDDIPARAPPVVHITDTDLELDFTERTVNPVASNTSLSQPVQDMQSKIEERYLSGTPETEDSRTDGEVHTSQVDSSALEDLPLKRDNRKKAPAKPGKIQEAFRTQAGKLKTKIQGIQKPKFEKFKIHKPNIHLPKIPDTATITLPSFTRKRTTKQIIKQRQISTESNAGDTKKKIFDFSTYPRMFKRKSKPDAETSSVKDVHERTPPLQPQQFATVPRTNHSKASKWAHTFTRMKKKESPKQQTKDRWGGSDTIRIPLHSVESEEKDEEDLNDSTKSEDGSHTRFNQDIGLEEAYERENQEIHRMSPFSADYNTRWNHGTFHADDEHEKHYKITDLDNDFHDEAQTPPSETFDINASKDIHSSGSSFEPHRHGVLEEINSDEFFLRQKGISQDDIDVGRYLHSEIREAFMQPAHKLQEDYYDRSENGSNESLPREKKKTIKKPKRKKTPHVSQEQMDSGRESEVENLELLPPVRPKRRSKRGKKPKNDVVPYQETIPIASDATIEDNVTHFKSTPLENYSIMYENEQMQGIEQPDIKITDPYDDTALNYKLYRHDRTLSKEDSFEVPTAPPRKHKSLKSLNFSEHDSILGEEPDYENRNQQQNAELSEEVEEPPMRPKRARSQSQGLSQPDDDRTSRGAESLASDGLIPCVEEPCVQDIRDYMGYSIVDKSKVRDPPLPPPRTPPRRRRSVGSNNKFSTVPRAQNESQPVRPQRNYSTLGPSRPPRSKVSNLTDEDKQSIDITQYIEIEEEPVKRLQSGEVIQKMRERPLPAPPRPPRRPRSVNDQTPDVDVSGMDETEVSTQTDALSEEFACDEAVDEPRSEQDRVRLAYFEAPTKYVHQETVTHGSILIEPLNGAQLIREHEFTRKERVIPVRKEYEDEETSEIPESFKTLKVSEEKPKETETVTVVKAQRLFVEDLDVNRMTVNELLANKITVSEIDGTIIQVNEGSSKDGTLKINGIELPPNVLQQICDRLRSLEQEQSKAEEEAASVTLVAADEISQNANAEQKKTSIEEINEAVEETPPLRPPRSASIKLEEVVDPQYSIEPLDNPPSLSEQQDPQTVPVESVTEPPPEIPIRIDSLETSNADISTESPQEHPPLDLDVDDEPPPRPPPADAYVPSQPPASFYALRAQKYVDYVDEDIPTPPRRRRHQKIPQPPSSSDEVVEASVSSRRRVRSPEPSIGQLTGQLVSACGTAAERSLKRLISHITANILNNKDGQQDLHVMMIILLVLIAGLILLGFGDQKTVHLHHWEFFNPPRNL